mmetsp:Transcript_117332/g.373826  ORF Transcript_117332/g.373826 Transcript_117332/m.373826 type:complete len:202 (+) Transcript_117332:390-995(+)
MLCGMPCGKSLRFPVRAASWLSTISMRRCWSAEGSLCQSQAPRGFGKRALVPQRSCPRRRPAHRHRHSGRQRCPRVSPRPHICRRQCLCLCRQLPSELRHLGHLLLRLCPHHVCPARQQALLRPGCHRRRCQHPARQGLHQALLRPCCRPQLQCLARHQALRRQWCRQGLCPQLVHPRWPLPRQLRILGWRRRSCTCRSTA